MIGRADVVRIAIVRAVPLDPARRQRVASALSLLMSMDWETIARCASRDLPVYPDMRLDRPVPAPVVRDAAAILRAAGYRSRA